MLAIIALILIWGFFGFSAVVWVLGLLFAFWMISLVCEFISDLGKPKHIPTKNDHGW